MKQIVLASTNQGKVREVAMMVQDMGIEIIPLSETAFQGEIEENGTTFEENAIIKATQVAKTLGVPALADDSGLEIDYLNKEPGIYSARYLGHDTPYAIKNKQILEKLKDVPEEQRTARFVCAMALVLPDGTTKTTQATMEGRIGYEIKGENGFGYDPIFYLPEFGKSSAEISPEQKNAISHRGKALRLMKDKIKELCKDEA
ncbi:XTP/dITP diphosphatase [Kineothrix sp. MSJ-39]|uniref:XTP/dITP diphosphatase n=1 Tax=Kineothrix sp. MSJ-39 TaxID=2841533 RepID=UPI001C109F3C|nr:XTP/dITP diphosphatase [Kineothrix sp. MSJ-39]